VDSLVWDFLHTDEGSLVGVVVGNTDITGLLYSVTEVYHSSASLKSASIAQSSYICCGTGDFRVLLSRPPRDPLRQAELQLWVEAEYMKIVKLKGGMTVEFLYAERE